VAWLPASPRLAIDRGRPNPSTPEVVMKRLFLAFVMLLASSFALAAVNLNTATKEELDALPGIGPVKAQAIIDYRNANGPFKSPQDVMKVRGIKEGEYGKIRDQISVSGATTLPPLAAKPETAHAATPSRAATTHAATTAPASSSAAAAPAATSSAAGPSTSKEAGTTKMTRAEERAAKAKAREEKAAKAKEEKAAKAAKAKEDKAAKAEKAKEDKMAKADARKSKAKSTSASSSNTKQEEKAKQ
jgi:competence protein ComEA